MPRTAAATCPPVVVFNSEPELMPEIQRLVDEAVVAVIMVVDAKGIDNPVPAGAAKLMVRAEPTSAPLPDSEMAVPAMGDEVAVDWYTPEPPPYRSWPDGAVVVPVPPFATVRAVARVSAPVVEKDDVAVAPKYAGPYAEKSVVDAAPLKRSSEVVADCPAAGWVKAS